MKRHGGRHAGWIYLASFASVSAALVAQPSDDGDRPEGVQASATVWQHLVFPDPFIMSQERFVRLTSEPDIESVSRYLREQVSRGGEAIEISYRDQPTSNRLVMEVAGARRLVIQNHDYWEHLTISAHLLETNGIEFDSNCPPDSPSRILADFDDEFSRRAREAQTLADEVCTPRRVFELVSMLMASSRQGAVHRQGP